MSTSPAATRITRVARLTSPTGAPVRALICGQPAMPASTDGEIEGQAGERAGTVDGLIQAPKRSSPSTTSPTHVKSGFVGRHRAPRGRPSPPAQASSPPLVRSARCRPGRGVAWPGDAHVEALLYRGLCHDLNEVFRGPQLWRGATLRGGRWNARRCGSVRGLAVGSGDEAITSFAPQRRCIDGLQGVVDRDVDDVDGLAVEPSGVADGAKMVDEAADRPPPPRPTMPLGAQCRLR